MKIPVAETFVSIQGEGPLAGLPFFFIRVAGCNVFCDHCDSKYSWKVDKSQYIECDALINKILLSNCDWISITGGEPLLYPKEVSYLIKNINKAGLHSHLETSGKYYDGSCFSEAQIVSADIKTPCTGVACEDDFKIIDRLKFKDYVKCLISTKEDLEFARKVHDISSRKCELILQVFNKENTVSGIDYKNRMYLNAYHNLITDVLNDKNKWFRTRIMPQLHYLVWHGEHGK